jgi:hypothetical protein
MFARSPSNNDVLLAGTTTTTMAAAGAGDDDGDVRVEFATGPQAEELGAIPIVRRTRWQHITGNVPVQALSPSPLKAALDLHHAVPSTSRKSFLKGTPSKQDLEMV